MNLQFTYPKIILYCWYIMLASVGMEYISKGLFTLEIATALGLLSMFHSKYFQLEKKDLKNILFMSLIMLGVIVSRLFFTPNIPTLVNVLFTVKMFTFFLFTYFFLTRYGFPFQSLYILALFSLPHFLGHFLGNNLIINNQFAGFHGDPNYLGPDLLTAFGASLVLVNRKDLKIGLKLIFAFTLLLSIYLVLLTVSRTATVALLLIVLFFVAKSFFTHKRGFIVKAIFVIFFALLIALNFSDLLIENVFVDRLYDRFFESKKGGDLVENERYVVWAISFELIQDAGLFQGYGLEQFLKKQYHFLSHNSWLDIGIKSGSYTFWTHSIVFVLGLLMWSFKYFTRIKKVQIWSPESFLLIFSFSISFMMFSISVSFMYYYWFILYLIYIKGILPWTQEELY